MTQVFTVTVRDSLAGSVLACAGELDQDRVPVFTRAAHRALAPQPVPPMLLLDLSAVTFMDSAALNALLLARIQARRQGTVVHLARPSHQVARLLDITGCDQVLPPSTRTCLSSGRLVDITGARGGARLTALVPRSGIPDRGRGGPGRPRRGRTPAARRTPPALPAAPPDGTHRSHRALCVSKAMRRGPRVLGRCPVVEPGERLHQRRAADTLLALLPGSYIPHRSGRLGRRPFAGRPARGYPADPPGACARFHRGRRVTARPLRGAVPQGRVSWIPVSRPAWPSWAGASCRP
ncbi:STAS domain-containing protein [Kitasatospora cathayae]|uniref:STAS domain-containing protein n=1 Tax=Kitasatospora cathayae TaxID=3004092 RepID=UPI0038600B51